MIQANGLRIGNYCYCQDDINVIYGITKEGFVQYEKDSNVYYCGIDELKPIELTEEILLKCGFEISTDKEHFFINYYGFCLVYDGKDYCLKMRIDEPYVVCYSRYLHQLQNLYFALTGEELEIN